MKELKNEKEIFEEIMDNYEKNIDEYEVVIKKTGKKQKHRKLKDNRYETQLNDLIVKNFTQNEKLNKDIKIKLKLGQPYNRSINPWIQLYYMKKNSKGTTGRYVGISFDNDKKNIELWIRFWYDSE